jgi:hypothetical protein
MDYCDGDIDEPPRELKLALQCRMWNNLPLAGGILDQPFRLVEKMSLSIRLYDVYSTMLRAENIAQWAKDQPDAYKFFAWAKQVRDAN